MADEFLSQDEVDSLLKGVAGVDDEAAPAEPVEGVRPYDLSTQQRIVRGRMPALETVNDRFARLLRVGLFNFMRRSPEITVAPVRFLKYGDFIRDLAAPANLNIAQVSPLRGVALVVLEPTLVFLIVDTLFGGDGRFRTAVDGREFTQTEMRIIQRLLNVVFDEYRKSWQPVYPLSLEYVRSEMHPQFANVAAASELVTISTFSIEFGAGGGAVHICLPYATLEPIRDLLGSPSHGDQPEPDKRWVTTLSQQVQAAEVMLVATLASTTLKVRELLAMQVGDVLPIDIAPTIEAAVDDVPILDCSYGVRNGQYALRIERLRAPEREFSKGEFNV